MKSKAPREKLEHPMDAQSAKTGWMRKVAQGSRKCKRRGTLNTDAMARAVGGISFPGPYLRVTCRGSVNVPMQQIYMYLFSIDELQASSFLERTIDIRKKTS